MGMFAMLNDLLDINNEFWKRLFLFTRIHLETWNHCQLKLGPPNAADSEQSWPGPGSPVTDRSEGKGLISPSIDPTHTRLVYVKVK